jgi:methionine-rich copper-binding protein CopC
MVSKRVLAGIFLSLQLIINPLSAYAHGDITGTSPKINSIVTASPKTIFMQFDGNLIVLSGKKSNFLTLVDSKGVEVRLTDSVVTGPKITAKILDQLTPGKYKVNWRIVSEDGHPVKGSFLFTFKPKTKS